MEYGMGADGPVPGLSDTPGWLERHRDAILLVAMVLSGSVSVSAITGVLWLVGALS
jgi:hypothetical protein